MAHLRLISGSFESTSRFAWHLPLLPTDGNRYLKGAARKDLQDEAVGCRKLLHSGRGNYCQPS